MLIGKLASESGLSKDTIRYYEKRGLLRSGCKNIQGNGYKNYPAEALERLHHIREFKELGFTLSEIGELLDMVSRHSDACAGLPEKLDKKIGILEKKMNMLALYKNRLEAVRQSCDGQCSKPTGLPECFNSFCC
ncbi:MerR family transcriptional regulator [Marinobacter sp. chi1]|uniref:MerR family transcriptional regulator n=1 Tax=Marinobacter suaedae TaxID=3057675 RepID=A0ABT8VXL8_9GAMM|nr:MerR family transcriptional regulator [Marinobacter sp. chi1]MDO3720738.1 MerR family transcriptional regulator [Marinobacter sp. chi1]